MLKEISRRDVERFAKPHHEPRVDPVRTSLEGVERLFRNPERRGESLGRNALFLPLLADTRTDDSVDRAGFRQFRPSN